MGFRISFIRVPKGFKLRNSFRDDNDFEQYNIKFGKVSEYVKYDTCTSIYNSVSNKNNRLFTQIDEDKDTVLGTVSKEQLLQWIVEIRKKKFISYLETMLGDDKDSEVQRKDYVNTKHKRWNDSWEGAPLSMELNLEEDTDIDRMLVSKSSTYKVLGRFDTKNQASEKLVEYITEKNNDVCSDEDGFLSIFDFDVQEEEIQEIASYEDANKYLGLSDEPVIPLCGVNKHYAKALLALLKLFTIAEAWNKEDGFVPDFSNKEQQKYFPRFEYKERSMNFVCISTNWVTTVVGWSSGSRLCFTTSKRAFDFGKKFEGLYNDLLLM